MATISMMLAALPWVLLGCAVLALVVYAFGLLATVRHTERVPFRIPEERYPPLSLLKPLKGDEEELEANLRSFFVQDYPGELEVIFATTERDDAALPVARRVAADYPEVEVRFVLSDAGFELNPKVANLQGALSAASHDLVLQSDANVRVRPDYLRRVVAELIAEDAALLSSLVVGVGDRSTGAALENLQLSGFIAPGCCFALRYFGVACVVGKSMLLRKSQLGAFGGLGRVKDILAEDFVLGRIYQEAGLNVVLSTTTAENVNVDSSVERFLSRHARWLKMRAVIHVPGFVADLFANPIGLAALAWATSLFDPRIGLALIALSVLKTLMTAYITKRIRGRGLGLRAFLLSPVKDILLAAIWPYAAFSRSVDWRGTRLRLSTDSRLRPDEGPLPVRVMRRLLGTS